MASKLDGLAKVPAKQKILMAVLFSVAIVVGYYYLYYTDAEAKTKVLTARLMSLQATIKEQQAIAGNLAFFKEEVAQLETQLSMLLDQLPNSAEIPSLLQNVSDLGKEVGLEFLKFAPSAEVKKDFYAEIPVSILVSGDYHSFIQFADKVSRYPRIINLSDIGFSSPTAARGGSVRSTVRCTATTYRFLGGSDTGGGR